MRKYKLIKHGLGRGLSCFLVLGLFISCGSDRAATKGKGPGVTTAEAAFSKSAKESGIPVRLLQAVAQVESRTNPTASFARYGQNLLAPSFAETAFGLSMKELGIADNAQRSELKTQVQAYAIWLRARLSSDLPKDPKTNDEKFALISAIAREHRRSANTRTVFAQELMNTLNEGFSWYDHADKKMLKFSKENPSIKREALAPHYQKQLALATRRSTDARNTALWLHHDDTSEKPTQDPKLIEIIHCPFSLSRCMELQSQSEEFGLRSHYVVPDSDQYTDLPLQFVANGDSVTSLQADGYSAYAQERVRVMLSGQSGRLVDGVRESADPSWLNKWQLRSAGQLVHDICSSIAHLHSNNQEEFDSGYRDCTVNKVSFLVQDDGSKPYSWGQIFDFDPLIFRTYIDYPSSLATQTDISLNNDGIFGAGKNIEVTLKFDPSVLHVDLERLVRCPNKKVMWLAISSDDVRGQSELKISKKFWDAGPNGDGTHFIRAKVYGRAREMVGWDQKSFLLQDYKDGPDVFSENVCPL